MLAKTIPVLCFIAIVFGKKANVLVFILDDLRPELPMYGDYGVAAPNIAELGKTSMTFNKAYSQQAICSPSRNSFLSGRRPDSTRVWNFINNFRGVGIDRHGVHGSNWTTLPEMFKENGYVTTGMGKVYHPGSPPKNDEPYSWTQEFPYFQPDPQIKTCLERGHGEPVCDNPESNCTDRWSADTAIQRLTTIKQKYNDRPFFMAVGFHKPHAFWAIPRQYYEMYRNPPTATNKKFPILAPPLSYYSCGPLMQTNVSENGLHYITPTTPLPEPSQKLIRSGYFGGITFADKQVGRVIQSLKDNGYYNDTIIVLWGDHGWALGEYNMWCKEANFEVHTRVPLMIRVPWLKETFGVKSDALVELVDVYPTLARLLNLKMTDALDGTSFEPVLNNPKMSPSNWKKAAFSQFPRCMNATVLRYKPYLATVSACANTEFNEFTHMGYTMRTEEWRYTEWPVWNGSAPNWTLVEGRELYDHRGDDGSNSYEKFENENLALYPEYAELVQNLSKQLRAGWTHALPGAV